MRIHGFQVARPGDSILVTRGKGPVHVFVPPDRALPVALVSVRRSLVRIGFHRRGQMVPMAISENAEGQGSIFYQRRRWISWKYPQGSERC
jgi:hypothetical protein